MIECDYPPCTNEANYEAYSNKHKKWSPLCNDHSALLRSLGKCRIRTLINLGVSDG